VEGATLKLPRAGSQLIRPLHTAQHVGRYSVCMYVVCMLYVCTVLYILTRVHTCGLQTWLQRPHAPLPLCPSSAAGAAAAVASGGGADARCADDVTGRTKSGDPPIRRCDNAAPASRCARRLHKRLVSRCRCGPSSSGSPPPLGAKSGHSPSCLPPFASLLPAPTGLSRPGTAGRVYGEKTTSQTPH
jgi:hypothetical protein